MKNYTGEREAQAGKSDSPASCPVDLVNRLIPNPLTCLNPVWQVLRTLDQQGNESLRVTTHATSIGWFALMYR